MRIRRDASLVLRLTVKGHNQLTSVDSSTERLGQCHGTIQKRHSGGRRENGPEVTDVSQNSFVCTILVVLTAHDSDTLIPFSRFRHDQPPLDLMTPTCLIVAPASN